MDHDLLRAESLLTQRNGRLGWKGTPALLRDAARAGLAAADACWTRVAPRLVPDAPTLVVLALHALCRTRAEVHDPHLAPGQRLCIDDLRALVAAAQESGYEFVSPEQVDRGLAADGRYAMLTFDDGYFNNALALPVLDEFRVPAAFFVSSRHVLTGTGFWWDALHREMARRGASRDTRRAATREAKALPPALIMPWLQARFGASVLRPHGDSDRPFAPAELTAFARHQWVHIGNHTADHAILTRCAAHEVREQIEGCQSELAALTGRQPIAIAYPNGNHSPAVIEAARATGLRLAFTVRPRSNALRPGGHPDLMRMGRFYFEGGGDVRRAFLACRSGIVPSLLVRDLLQA